jgi:DNA-binding transcriptional regulator YiaG
MTTKPDTQNPIPDTLKALEHRLGLSQEGAADYLGVTIHAYRKWRNGTRNPEGSAIRLLEVLGFLETLAPDIHSAIVGMTRKA